MAIRYLSGINVDSNTLFVDSTNNRVGIGTGSPSQPLHVIGNAWINRPSNKVDNNGATEFGSRVEFNNSFASNQSGYMVFLYPSYNNFLIGGDHDGNIGGVAPNIQFGRSNGTVYMHIASSNGNVGIGTTSPTETLDLRGVLRVSRSGVNDSGVIAFGNYVNGAGYYDNGIFRSSLNAITTSGNVLHMGSYDALAFTASANPLGSQAIRMYISGTSGNVGIGTTSPDNVLDLGAASQGRALTWDNYSNVFGAYSSGNLVLSQNFYGDTATDTYKTSLTASYGAAGILISGTAAGLNGVMRFYVDNATAKTAGAAFTPTERMQISGNGAIKFSTYGSGSFTGTATYGLAVDSSGNIIEVTSAIDGSGTANYVTKWQDSNTLTNSVIYDNGTNVGVGTTSPYAGTGVRSITVNASSYPTFALKVGDTFVGGVFGYSDHVDLYAEGYLNFETGGSEKMRITSAGNVGIGTTSPAQPLHVYTSGATPVLLERSTSNANVSAQFKDQTSSWYIGKASNGYFAIGEQANLGAVTIFNITDGGNVGIGTNSPSSMLTLNGTTPYIRLERSGVPTWELRQNFPSTEYGFQIVNVTAGTIPFFVGNSGNVGIGTTSPAVRLSGKVLSLNDTSANLQSSIELLRNGNSSGEIFVNSDNMVIGSYQTGIPLVFRTENNEHLRITSAGNVGIGTTSPTAKLDISAGTNLNLGVQQLVLDNFTNDGVGITFSRTSSDADLMALGVVDSDKLGLFSRSGIIFATGGTTSYSATSEVMRIAEGGNVGIGTTSPISKVQSQIEASGSALLLVNAAGGGGAYVDLDFNTYSVNQVGYANPGATIRVIDDANYSGHITFRTKGGSIGAAQTEVVRIASSGNVGIGTTTPGATFSEKLQITKSDVSRINITHTNTTGARQSDVLFTEGETLQFQVGTVLSNGTYPDQNWLRGTTDLPVIIHTNSLERLRVTSGGSVGIGTDSPGQKLTVNGTAAAYSAIGDADNVRTGLAHYDTTAQAAGVGGQLVLGYKYTNAGDYTEGAIIKMYKDNSVSGEYGSGLKFQVRNTGANLSTKLVLDSSGRLGIGTTAPSSKLEVNAGTTAEFSFQVDANSTFAFGSTNGTRLAYLRNPTVGDNGLQFGTDTVDSTGIIAGGATSAGTGIDFYTYNGSAWGNRVRITKTGNVGIGTTAPTAGYKLDVVGSILSQVASGNTSIVVSTNNANGAMNAIAGSGLEIATDSTNQNISFRTGASSRMYIKSDGNVGIGTTSPTYKLSVEESTTNPIAYFGLLPTNASSRNSLIILQSGTIPQSGSDTTGEVGFLFRHSYGTGGVNGTANGGYIESIRESVFGITSQVNTALIFGTSAANTDNERMRINSAGNVGIGNSSPQANGASAVLDVGNGSGGTLNLRDTNTGIAAEGFNQIFGGDNRMYLYAGGSGASSYMQFYTNDVERMRIHTNGNFGVGTTNPIQPLTVSAIANASTIALLGRAADNASRIDFYNNAGNSRLYTVALGNSAVEHYADANIPMVFSTNAAERMRITAAGNVGIGTTAPTAEAKVHIVGQGTYYGLQVDCSLSNTGGSDNLFLRNTSSGNYVSIGLSANDSDGQHHRAVLKAKKDPVNAGTAAGIFQIDVRNTSGGYTTALTVDALANIGIGTTAPAYKLQVKSSGLNSIPFAVQRAANTNNIFYVYEDSSGNGNLTVENSGGNVGVFLNSSGNSYLNGGNVGIGTTVPGYKLDVFGASNTDAFVRVIGGAGATKGGYVFGNNDGTKDYGKIYFDNSNNNIYFFQYYNAGDIIFGANSTERMRMTNAGNFGIGSTSPNGKLTVDNGPSNIPTLTLNSLTGGQYYSNINCYDPYHGIILRGIPAAATDYTVTAQDSMSFYEYGSDFRFYKKTATPSLQLDAQILAGEGRFRGDVVAYYSFSDERLKDDVKPLEGSLDKVLALQGVSYKWNSGERKGQSDIGLIAQQVEKVIPEVVREKTNIDGDTFKSVNYEHLVGVLIEAIKEQQQQIDELKAKLK